MTLLVVVLAVAAILGGCWLVFTGLASPMSDPAPDAADVGLPWNELTANDVEGLRFAMALRGYRMSEVDEVLDRVTEELKFRDERIARLETELSERGIAPAAPVELDGEALATTSLINEDEVPAWAFEGSDEFMSEPEPESPQAPQPPDPGPAPEPEAPRPSEPVEPIVPGVPSTPPVPPSPSA